MNRFVLSLVAPILGLLLVATDAKAILGNGLMESCNGLERSSALGFCVGYVVAVADVEMAKMKKDFCIPPAVTQGQLAKVAVKWLEENPDKLHFSANSLVSAAFANSFKCN